jgi:hypothetical protein
MNVKILHKTKKKKTQTAMKPQIYSGRIPTYFDFRMYQNYNSTTRNEWFLQGGVREMETHATE